MISFRPGSPPLRPIAVLWTCVIALVALWGWVRLQEAYASRAGAVDHFDALMVTLRRIEALRTQSPQVSLERRPDTDLVARCQKALTEAGLPVATFSGIQPRADQVAGTSGSHIQTVQVTLRGLRPEDIGAWLGAWATDDQPWRISEVQLTHQAGAGAIRPSASASALNGSSLSQNGNMLDGNRFDCVFVLSASYLKGKS